MISPCFNHFMKPTKYKNEKIFSSCYAKLEKYKNTKKYVLSFFAELKEYKNTNIKHVSSCFAKLKNTKQCLEMFPFEALQTFRVSSLSFDLHSFLTVFLCGLFSCLLFGFRIFSRGFFLFSSF